MKKLEIIYVNCNQQRSLSFDLILVLSFYTDNLEKDLKEPFHK